MVHPGKVSVKCFPVQPIKEQVKQIAFSIKFKTSDISDETWSRYPCSIEKTCRTDHCDGDVSFIVTDKALRTVKILKLFFVREDKNAYVYINQQLRKLLEDGILSPVESVTIHLKPPIIPEPTKRAVSWNK